MFSDCLNWTILESSSLTCVVTCYRWSFLAVQLVWCGACSPLTQPCSWANSCDVVRLWAVPAVCSSESVTVWEWRGWSQRINEALTMWCFKIQWRNRADFLEEGWSIMQFLLAHLALCGLVPVAFPQLLDVDSWVLCSLFTPFLLLSSVLLAGN